MFAMEDRNEKEVIKKIGEKYNTQFNLSGAKTYDAVGCDKCNNSGYYQRTGIFEVLNNVVKKIIKNEILKYQFVFSLK